MPQTDPLDLEAIRAALKEAQDEGMFEPYLYREMVNRDIPALIAEVERLRAVAAEALRHLEAMQERATDIGRRLDAMQARLGREAQP